MTQPPKRRTTVVYCCVRRVRHTWSSSLPNTKVCKEHVEHVLDVHAAEDAANRANRTAQLLGSDLALVRVLEELVEASEALDEALAVALACDDRAARRATAGRELEPVEVVRATQPTGLLDSDTVRMSNERKRTCA